MRASRYFTSAAAEVGSREEARFFNALKTANDTFKRTSAGRLAVIDREVVARVAQARASIAEVLDLGISAGVTTLELRDALAAAGHNPRVTGTDLSVRAALVPLPLGCCALVQPPGHVLQYEVAGRAVRPWRRRLDYVTGMGAAAWLVDRAFRATVLARSDQPGRHRPVALVTRRLAEAGDIAIVEDDVTVANPALVGRFDLVRAANLLNRHYFTPEALAAAVANVRSYLKGAGAWLLVLRTHGEDDHRGTLFRMNDMGRLQAELRWGGGSEIEAMLLG